MSKAERKAELEARVKLLEDLVQGIFDELAEREAAAEWAESAQVAEHAPSVPRPPTVGDDYHFFLRVNGFNDHPCLWRAFLAGRLTA